MTPAVEQILAEYLLAREQGQPSSVDELLQTHPEVAEEIREYLDLNDEFAGLLNSCAIDQSLHDTVTQFPISFGEYLLLAELGSGGMGIVFQALHRPTGRIVALKMLRGGRFSSMSEHSRFHRESTAMMQLVHPSIVTIFVVDTCDGHPFFTMQLMPGGTLRDRFATNRPDPKNAASIVGELADAVQYAHQHGLIHRDIKPSNILFDNDHRPYLADFGLAKWLENTDHQLSHSIQTGTPGYMAPEQRGTNQAAITTATDVYGLGGILHFLLTGVSPSDSDVLARFSHIPPDLDAIRRKALAPKHTDRYASAGELKDDLNRYRNGQTVSARMPSYIERSIRFCMRNPLLSLLILLTTLALWSAIYFAWRDHTNSRELNKQLQHTIEQLQQSLTLGYEQRELLADANHTLTVLQACQLHREGKSHAASDLLTTTRNRRLLSAPNLLESILDRLVSHHQTMEIDDPSIKAFAIHPLGTIMATVSAGGVIHLRDCETGKSIQKWNTQISNWYELDYRPDGHAIACWFQCTDGSHEVQIYSANGKLLHELKLKWLHIDVMEWSSDSSTLIIAGRQEHQQTILAGWNPKTNVLVPYVVPTAPHVSLLQQRPKYDGVCGIMGTNLVTVTNSNLAPKVIPLNCPSAILSLDVSPEGTKAICIAANGTLMMVDLVQLTILWQQQLPNADGKHHVVWTDQGTSITALIGTHSGTVRQVFEAHSGKSLHQELLDVRSYDLVRRSTDMQQLFLYSTSGIFHRLRNPKKPCDELQGHQGEVWAVAFSPNGELLASGADDATVRLWDIVTRRELAVFKGHTALVMGVVFSPDGKNLYSCSWDRSIAVWDVSTKQLVARWHAHDGPITNIVIAPDSKFLYTRSRDGTLKVWNTITHELLRTLPGDARRSCVFALSSDGLRLMANTDASTITIWDTATWNQTGQWLLKNGHVDCGAWTPNGDIILGYDSGTVEIRKLASNGDITWHHNRKDSIERITVSPDDRYLLASTSSQSPKDRVRLYDRHSGQPLLELPHHSTTFGLAFSPNARLVATASHDGLVRIWGVK